MIVISLSRATPEKHKKKKKKTYYFSAGLKNNKK